MQGQRKKKDTANVKRKLKQNKRPTQSRREGGKKLMQRRRQHVGHGWLAGRQRISGNHVSIHKHTQKGLWREPSEVRSNPAPTLTMPLKPIVQS